MRRLRSTILLLVTVLFTTSCWNKAELTDWAFVQAVAIDMAENGKLKLTVHFYKPGAGSGSIEGGPQGPASFNISAKADTIFEAVRDIIIHLGRKAQWSHMRIILVSDQVGRKRDVREVISFFLRDHEPRENVQVAIAKGRASEYLKQKPFIESTIGEQLRDMADTVYQYNGKTLNMSMLNMAIQFKNQTGVAVLPIIYSSETQPEINSLANLAVLKNGKLVDNFLTTKDVKQLLVLRNQFRKGIIEYPCSKNPSEKETLEVIEWKTAIKVKPDKDTVAVKVHTKLIGSFGEIRCTSALNPKDEQAVVERIRKSIEQDLQQTIALMQSKELDLIGVGEKLFQKNPTLWWKWKSTWEQKFAEAAFDIQVDLKVTNSGLLIPKPYYK